LKIKKIKGLKEYLNQPELTCKTQVRRMKSSYKKWIKEKYKVQFLINPMLKD
jgi:hypothetical protein